MRVVITNCSLRGRSGTEMVTIDLALGLSRRGHEVAVFAPLIGLSADILRHQGIVVADRPEDLPWRPDIIHGHHNHVLAAALAYFPDAPSLFVSHSSTYWFDGPPLLPRVRRFYAVDEACRARVAIEVGVETQAVELLPNAVDLAQFLPRASLPEKPRRALLLTKNTAHVPAVRAAAQQTGLELDEIGAPFGREVDDLPSRLRQYDLVFATARMALEALAAGCAVVVVDGRGLAGLASSATIDEWRRNNFGLRLLTREPTTPALVTEIGRYDAQDAALASSRIREIAALSSHLDRVETIYRDILASPSNVADPADDLRALGRFVGQWLRRLGEGMIPENFDHLLAANKFAGEHRLVVDENVALRARLESLHTRVNELGSALDSRNRELEALDREAAMLRAALRSPLELMRSFAGVVRQRLSPGR